MMSILLPTLLLLFMAAAAVSDFRHRRIPNTLVALGLVVALGMRAAPGGPDLTHGLTGALVALLLGFTFYAARIFGAGDGKLLAMGGAFAGLPVLLPAIFWTAIAGGLLGLIALAAREHRAGNPMGSGLRLRLHAWLADLKAGRLTPPDVSDAARLRVPYGVAIAAGFSFAAFAPPAFLALYAS